MTKMEMKTDEGLSQKDNCDQNRAECRVVTVFIILRLHPDDLCPSKHSFTCLLKTGAGSLPEVENHNEGGRLVANFHTVVAYN